MPKFAPVGTTNSESYGHFQTGRHWELVGERAEARRQYTLALQRDPKNRGALVNLAVLDFEDGQYAQAFRALMEAREEQAGQEVWHKATYQLADQLAYLHYLAADDPRLVREKARSSSLSEQLNKEGGVGPAAARDFAEELVSRLGRTGARLLPWRYAKPTTSQETLEDLRPHAVALLACVLVDAPSKTRNPVALLGTLTEGERLKPGVGYALARYDSLRAAKLGRAEGANALDSSMEHLREVLKNGGGPPGARIRADPLLKAVREEDRTKDQFDNLLDSLTPTSPPTAATAEPKTASVVKAPVTESALSQVAAIGPDYAKVLEAQQITSAADLVRMDTPGNELGPVADRLRVSVESLQQWIQFAHLLNIPGIGPAEVNLLEAARIFSRIELVNADAYRLAATLQEENRARRLVADPPTAADIRAWQQAAFAPH